MPDVRPSSLIALSTPSNPSAASDRSDDPSAPHPVLIDGRWREGAAIYENRSPSDLEDLVGLYWLADRALAKEAVEAAARAQPAWAAVSPLQRADVLERAARDIDSRAQELGRLLAREEGKTLIEAVAEVQRAAQILRFHAQQALRAHGELYPSTRLGLQVEVTHEPVGVVAVIAPWNFPIAIPAWKIAPALAYGNTVVFKPAEKVPASAWALVDALQRAGLPSGALNLVPGPGRTVGQALLDHPMVDAVSFTGSQSTGKRVAAACSARAARYQLEMGGKNPLVVLDDADLALAVDCAVQGAYFSTGQRCTATSRLIATPAILPRLREALIERTRSLRVGHALDADTEIGPVVDEIQLEQDLTAIAQAQAEGATLAVGGHLLAHEKRGHYLAPALFTEAENTMRLCREEIFGPVLALIPARDADHALALANDTPFGLAAGVCTRSMASARHFQRHLQAGMVMVNCPTAGVDHHVPFGGRKASSAGSREQGTAAREFYTQVKTCYVRA